MPGVPPVPIPNTAVKPRAANGSRTLGPARVGRCQVMARMLRKQHPGPLIFVYMVQVNSAQFLSDIAIGSSTAKKKAAISIAIEQDMMKRQELVYTMHSVSMNQRQVSPIPCDRIHLTHVVQCPTSSDMRLVTYAGINLHSVGDVNSR